MSHVIYGKYTDERLQEEIKFLVSSRKTASAGRDLIELRKEAERRRNVKLAKTKQRTYNKQVLHKTNEGTMLENPAESPKFKKANFAGTGMSPKQEKFCIEYMGTGDALSAYKAAGYKEGKNLNDTRRRAASLLKNPKIDERVKDIREEAIKKMAWSADRVLDRLDQVYQHSLSNGDYSNANRSIEAVAKHLGMFVDRTESRVKLSSFNNETDHDSVQGDIAKLAEIAGLKVIDGGKSK